MLRKTVGLSVAFLFSTFLQTTSSLANDLGGYAVVHPEGYVCGVIVGNSYFSGNDKTMTSEFMGCPLGSQIIFQTKPSPSGNVAGWHGVDVRYANGVFTLGNGTTIANGIATDPDGRVWDTGSGETITLSPSVNPPTPSETTVVTSPENPPTPSETTVVTSPENPPTPSETTVVTSSIDLNTQIRVGIYLISGRTSEIYNRNSGLADSSNQIQWVTCLESLSGAFLYPYRDKIKYTYLVTGPNGQIQRGAWENWGSSDSDSMSSCTSNSGSGNMYTIAYNLTNLSPSTSYTFSISGTTSNGSFENSAVFTTIGTTTSQPSVETSATTSQPSVETSATTSQPSVETSTTTSQPSVETSTTTSQPSVETSTTTSENEIISQQMNGTVKELKVLVQDLVNNVVEKSRFIRLLNRLDSINTKTSLKSLTLPGSNFFESNTESKTPRRCSVDGTTVDRLRSGTCVISYTITSSDGTDFTTEKKIRFKQ